MWAIKEKNIFDENMYQKTYHCGSKSASIYRLPKIHKELLDSDAFSLWPTISYIGAYNCNLARFLNEPFDPVIPKEHYVKYLFSSC